MEEVELGGLEEEEEEQQQDLALVGIANDKYRFTSFGDREEVSF